jgi:hypothetical protein
MAYKKYIQRNGKLYGPYLYESKRVDGKVVSEYHGSEEPKQSKGVKVRDYKKILFLFLGVFVLGILIYFLATVPNYNKISGKAVFGLDASYVGGEPLEGVLKFSLKEGEFIPASSRVVFENSEKNYSFVLGEVLSESSSEGKYYLENKLVEGEGPGYGYEGEVEVYPEVGFILQIYKESLEEEPLEEIVDEELVQENLEDVEEVQNVEDDVEVVDESNPAAITGGVVRDSGGFFNSLFGATGMVSLELQDEVQGVVSKDKSFVYELKEGEKAELKPKSVFIGGEEVSDSTISLEVKDNQIIITTSYSVIEKGYGEEYLGDKEKTLSLDLSDLNLSFEEGDLNVKLLYGDEEIIHLSTILKEGEDNLEEVLEEEIDEELNEIEEVVEVPSELELSEEIVLENETVEEIINSSLWDMGNFLTPEEKEVLTKEFGDIELKTIKSELFKDRIIIGYDFGGYSVEYSYDSSLSKEILDIYMEKDRIKFLKDIASSLSKEASSPTPYLP